MARQRKAAKRNEVFHLSVQVDGEIVGAIDAEADRMTSADPIHRVTTRADVVRHWLRTMATKKKQ